MRPRLEFLLVMAACSPTSKNVAVRPGPAVIVEDSVEISTPAGAVKGTLQLPARSFPVPVVLIIAGSGPTDRNGNSRLIPGANNSLKLLARGLAERGIASVRYDKRGIAASRIPDAKEEDARFDHFVDDARQWIRQLRSDSRFSTVVVAGHSEGSLIGMIAAREAAADGYVSIAGAGRNAKDVILDQLSAQMQPAVVNLAKEIMDRIEKGQAPDSVPVFLNALFRPSVRPYLASWFRYTPSVEIGKLNVPALVIQGTHDIQVSSSEARILAAGAPAARIVMIDGMNHVLKDAPAGRMEQGRTYSDSTLAVVPKLIDEIAAFVASLRAPKVSRDDPLFGTDKVKHFLIAGFVEAMAFAALEIVGTSKSGAHAGSLGASTAASLGREIHDGRTKGFFSVRDLGWDALGAGAAFLLLSRTQR